MSKKSSRPRLTLKTAQALAVKVTGTAKGLAKDKEIHTFDLYEMRLGLLFVQIRYDWYGSGRISVSIDNHFGHSIFMLFDPVTLEEDCEAEDRQKERDNRERLNEWVDSIGPELCKEQIDRAWNRDN